MRAILLALLFLVTLPVQARQNLVCFTQHGLTSVLATVVNPQQLLQNSFGHSVLSQHSCDVVEIPPGSQATPAGFYTSGNGFIFPLFRIEYSTTRQQMFAADGIFSTNEWVLAPSGVCPGCLHIVPRQQYYVPPPAPMMQYRENRYVPHEYRQHYRQDRHSVPHRNFTFDDLKRERARRKMEEERWERMGERRDRRFRHEDRHHH